MKYNHISKTVGKLYAMEIKHKTIKSVSTYIWLKIVQGQY